MCQWPCESPAIYFCVSVPRGVGSGGCAGAGGGCVYLLSDNAVQSGNVSGWLDPALLSRTLCTFHPGQSSAHSFHERCFISFVKEQLTFQHAANDTNAGGPAGRGRGRADFLDSPWLKAPLHYYML